MSTVKKADQCETAVEALITWYDDFTQGRSPSVARRRAIVEELRRSDPHPEAMVACDIDLLARPDPAQLRTDSLLAIERLRRHTDEGAPAIGATQTELRG